MHDSGRMMRRAAWMAAMAMAVAGGHAAAAPITSPTVRTTDYLAEQSSRMGMRSWGSPHDIGISPFEIQSHPSLVDPSLAHLLTHAPITVPVEVASVPRVQAARPDAPAPSQAVPEPLGLVVFAVGAGAVWGRRPRRPQRR